MSAHGKLGPMNSDSIFFRVRPGTLATSTSEQNEHSDLDPNDRVTCT